MYNLKANKGIDLIIKGAMLLIDDTILVYTNIGEYELKGKILYRYNKYDDTIPEKITIDTQIYNTIDNLLDLPF